jgi:hypothetical protein
LQAISFDGPGFRALYQTKNKNFPIPQRYELVCSLYKELLLSRFIPGKGEFFDFTPKDDPVQGAGRASAG